jgi:hypothetical protein
MKIPPAPQNTQPRATPADAARGKRNATAADPDAAEVSGASEGEATGRDFASVLDEVSGAREGERRETDSRGERAEAKSSERAIESPPSKRREEQKGDEGDSKGGGGGFEQRASLRETVTTQEQPGARAILHIADLERIVSAVRTQTLAAGAREVTIELRRSVLEGLRVKLSSDGAGRVTAEFLAASERVRAQIDARASELAEIMRSRGVNLASVRTSVGAGASDSDARGGQAEGAREDLSRRASAVRNTVVADDDATFGDANAEESHTTYRG